MVGSKYFLVDFKGLLEPVLRFTLGFLLEYEGKSDTKQLILGNKRTCFKEQRFSP